MNSSSMQTRLTFKHHRLALAALHDCVKRRNLVGSDRALGEFAELCLRPPTGPSPLLARVLTAVDCAAEDTSGRKPGWARRAEAVLHVTERLLGAVKTARRRAEKTHNPVSAYRARGVGCGTYSTPDFIADEMCRSVARSLRRRGTQISRDILDLSLEGGNYPLAYLTLRDGLPVRFYAVDRDSEAINLANRILSYARAGAADANFAFFSRHQDSILEPLPSSWPATFDAVVGNPPWQTRDPVDAPRLQRRFGGVLTGQFDVYLAFMLRAHALLKPGGVLSMVVPSPFLFNRNAEVVRRLFLLHYDILSLTIYPRRSFIELPAVAPVALLLRKSVGTIKPARTKVSYYGGGLGGPTRPRLTKVGGFPQVWAKLPGATFNPAATRESLFLLSLNGGECLGHFGHFHCGARLGTARRAANTEPFVGLFGRDIRSFHACLRGAVSFAAGTATFDRAPRADLFARGKVLFQDVRCMTLPRRIVAAQSGAQTMPVSTSSMFVPHQEEQIDFFEALLNSDFANAWYKLRDVHRCIKLCVLAEMPIRFERVAWRTVAQCGREIAHIKQRQHALLASCVAPGEERSWPQRFPRLSRRSASLHAKMNAEIFALYELSARQRRVVELLSQQRVF